MKAKEWVVKFNEAGVDNGSLLEEFAFETRELVELRTKNSDKKTKGFAADGAMREQRQKWDAICRKVGWLRSDMFEDVLKLHLNDIRESQEQWRERLNGKPAADEAEAEGEGEAKQEEGQEEAVYGRKLAASLAD